VWTAEEYAKVMGLTTFAVIPATLLGGYLGDRFGRRLILIVGFGGYGLVAATFAACPQLWNEKWFTTTYLFSAETFAAVGAVGFLAMAMRISWSAAAATVFTSYMALSNVSRLTGNFLAGPVRKLFTFSEYYGDSADMVSYELTFWFICVVTLLPLLLLIVVRPAEVDRAREAESAAE